MRIVDAARRLLQTQGYAALSLRTVASRAGIRLGNLQYYFPNKHALVHAVLADIAEPYAAQLPEVRNKAGATALGQFRAWIEFLIDDAFKVETQRLFIQTWAMADGTGRSADTFLGELYAHDIAQIESLLGAANPVLTPSGRRVRAHVLAAVIEGLMVTARALPTSTRRAFRAEVLALAMRYASSI